MLNFAMPLSSTLRNIYYLHYAGSTLFIRNTLCECWMENKTGNRMNRISGLKIYKHFLNTKIYLKKINPLFILNKDHLV